MKTMDYWNLAWLIVAMSTMLYMAGNMWVTSRRNKKEAAAWMKRNDEIHAKMMEYMNAQIANAKKQGKEPWEP